MKRPESVAPDWVWDEVSNLDYAHAAVVLGVPVGFLKEKAPKRKIPSTKLGKHRVFSPANIAAIRAENLCPAETDSPVQAVPAYSDDDAYRAKLRAAIERTERAAA